MNKSAAQPTLLSDIFTSKGDVEYVFKFLSPPNRVQFRVLSQLTFPTQLLVSGLLIRPTFQLHHLSFPQLSSAPPSVTCPLWSLTHHCVTRAPPRRRTHWEVFLQGTQMERGKESLLAGLTHYLSTLSLVSTGCNVVVFS